ncbi:hypothetical protein CC86DRAFT_462955 [Ophiobolus disseminans]|uniref:Tat pathway signal sequence n=1 Tax=Ophiobolus disseminans TaxID=1469910 RepID=A0A6A7AIG8_9PLEO|nr:hypothetical protein CC86DRAFT_462955 [Ophiobolus disseminans]
MWNPFKQRNGSYLQLSGQKEFHSNDSSSDQGLTSAATLVHKDEQDYFDAHGLLRKKSTFTSPSCTILIALLSLITGLVAGHVLHLEPSVDGYLRTPPFTIPNPRIAVTENLGMVIEPYSPPHPIHTHWTLNSSLNQTPSVANEATWTSLMPLGRGFITHPRLTHGGIESLTAFHPLHCLHTLETAYFGQTNFLAALRHSTNASYPYLPDSHLDGLTEHQLGLFHVEHCFVYLRQEVMCAADTNLEETRVMEVGMVEAVAFEGSERVCRYWEDVRGGRKCGGVEVWRYGGVEVWRSGGGEGIV